MPVRDDSVREQITQVGGTPLRVAIRPGTGTGPPFLGKGLENSRSDQGFSDPGNVPPPPSP